MEITKGTIKKKTGSKWIRNSIITLLFVLGVFTYFKFFYALGTGVKAGQLNYVVHKGYVFKTYEGKLIQAGYKGSTKTGVTTGIQSYEFEFSIIDKALADTLMLAGGKEVQLRYREYLGAVPWRGYSKYVVYDIVAIE